MVGCNRGTLGWEGSSGVPTIPPEPLDDGLSKQQVYLMVHSSYCTWIYSLKACFCQQVKLAEDQTMV